MSYPPFQQRADMPMAACCAQDRARHRVQRRARTATGPGLLGRALATLRLWRARIAEREELARLDEIGRRDLGFSPSEIRHEIRKPFWRG